MQSRQRPVTPRFDTIDLLRGLSIVAVILLHTYIRMEDYGFHIPRPAPWWLRTLIFNGGNGVTVFFAISGFLIAFTSIKRFGGLPAMRPLAFYRIRFARIAPTLLLLLAVLSVLHLARVEGFRIDFRKGESLPGALFAALTFHLNWYEALHGFLPANWDVLWSLSVEETFYIFFPLVCFFVLQRRRGHWFFFATLLAFILMGPFARTIWTASNGIWQNNSYLGGTDAIAFGVIAALLAVYLRKRQLSARTLLALQAVGTLLMVWVCCWPRWQWIRPASRFLGRTGLDDTVLPIGVCLVLLASVLRSQPGFALTAPIRWFGRHSYEVYLTHEFVVIGAAGLHDKYKGGPLALWYLAVVLLTAPLGWAVARFFSEPLNRRLRISQLPGTKPPHQAIDASILHTTPTVARVDFLKPPETP